MISSILVTILLVLLNGFFVAAEFAMVKVRASQLEVKAKSGNKIVPYSQKLLKNLDAYLSATQLGITIASLLLGYYGEHIMSDAIKYIFAHYQIQASEEFIHSLSIPLAFATITVLHIVIGEQAPKSIAIRYPENTTIAVTVPLNVFYFIFRPFIWMLNTMSIGVLKLLGIKAATGHDYHSAEELMVLLDQGKDSGAIKGPEHELITNVFYFKERTVKQIMVPRTSMSAVELPASNKEVMETFIEEGYTRLPVYVDSIDNIIGIIHAKELLKALKNRDNFNNLNLKDILRPAHFVPETKNISELLHEMKQKHHLMAIVLDEFGGTSGIVTMEDIIEELVGEIQDEYDEEKPNVHVVSDDEFNVNALAAISDVNEHLPFPLPESEDYDTVGGFANYVFKKIPEVNDVTFFGPYEVTIAQKTKRSIQTIRFKIIAPITAEE